MKHVILVLAFLQVTVQAQDEPRALVRSHLEPEGTVLVGQPVRLNVDVFVTTWLTGAPQFPGLEMDGAVVTLPDERPVNLNEQIDGETWFGISRSYLVYPLEPREYQTPSPEIVVKYGQASEPATLSVPTQKFRAVIPAEARDLGYFIATTDFELEQELDRDLASLKVGDTLRRTVRMYADKTLAMLLPPVEFEPSEGLSVYPDPPQVRDRSEGREGFLGGERRDAATFLIEKAGRHRLAPVEVTWWDLGSGRLRQATLPALEFDAATNPDYQLEIPLPTEEEEASLDAPPESWWNGLTSRIVPVALLLILLLLLVRHVPESIRKLASFLAARKRSYERSEAAAFEQFGRRLLAGDPQQALIHFYLWLNRITPAGRIPLLDSLGGDSSYAELVQEIRCLEAGVYGDSSPGIDGRAMRRLYERFRRARRQLLQEQTGGAARSVQLPGLNPKQQGD